eukprot:COSAG06_NODE_796_length_12220_cov_4.708522_9_plen_191_part_00
MFAIECPQHFIGSLLHTSMIEGIRPHQARRMPLHVCQGFPRRTRNPCDKGHKALCPLSMGGIRPYAPHQSHEPARSLPDQLVFRPVSCPRQPPDSRRCLLLEHVHAHVDHLNLLHALLERELHPLRPSTLSCHRCRDLRAATSDAYTGWAGSVAAGRCAPSHPGQHGHIALLTAFGAWRWQTPKWPICGY